MKFVVTKGYSNEVDVKLHWESRDKILKGLWYGTLFAVSAVSTRYLVNDKKKSND
jgi:hypothetical protein